MPIVTAALDDPDPEVVVSAIKVLEARADVTHLRPSLVALQRISASATKQNLCGILRCTGHAQQLLQSTRWKPDATTTVAVANDSPHAHDSEALKWRRLNKYPKPIATAPGYADIAVFIG